MSFVGAENDSDLMKQLHAMKRRSNCFEAGSHLYLSIFVPSLWLNSPTANLGPGPFVRILAARAKTRTPLLLLGHQETGLGRPKKTKQKM